MSSASYREIHEAISQYLAGQRPLAAVRDLQVALLWQGHLAADAQELVDEFEGLYAELTGGLLDEAELQRELRAMVPRETPVTPSFPGA